MPNNDPKSLAEILKTAHVLRGRKTSTPAGSPSEPLAAAEKAKRLSIIELTDQHQRPQAKRHWPRKARRLSAVPREILTVLDDVISGQKPWPLYLWSKSPGTGKTCAGLVVADLWERSRPWPFEDFANGLLDAKFGRSEIGSLATWWGFVVSRSFVFLDDVGTRERANETQYEAFKGVLDRREGLPLMVTSNLPPSSMVGIFDARVADRLVAGTTFEVVGESMR